MLVGIHGMLRSDEVAFASVAYITQAVVKFTIRTIRSSDSHAK